MRSLRPLLSVLVIALAVAGCFRTHYVNLYAADYQPKEPPTRRAESTATWRNFWIFGWVPGEMEIRTADVCGEGYVREIETEQSFLQGLVTALSTVYINIYSPWTGKIRCFEPE